MIGTEVQRAIAYRVALVTERFDVWVSICLVHPVRGVGQVVNFQLVHGILVPKGNLNRSISSDFHKHFRLYGRR